MKNINTLVFTCGNPPEHRPVDFEEIHCIYTLTDCYHLKLTNCYMEWNPISHAKCEYFYMQPNDYIIYKKKRYTYDEIPRLEYSVQFKNIKFECDENIYAFWTTHLCNVTDCISYKGKFYSFFEMPNLSMLIEQEKINEALDAL